MLLFYAANFIGGSKNNQSHEGLNKNNSQQKLAH